VPGIVCTVPVKKVVQKPSVARRVNEAGVMVHALVRACGVRPACRLEIGHDPAAYYGRWTCLRRPAAGSRCHSPRFFQPGVIDIGEGQTSPLTRVAQRQFATQATARTGNHDPLSCCLHVFPLSVTRRC